MIFSTIWLEIVRVVLGILILLAIATLYKLFKNTKIVQELHIISLGFLLYTTQAAIGAMQSYGYQPPIVWAGLELDEFMEAVMFIVFAIGVVRVKAIFDYLEVEDELIKAIRKLVGQ